jgi:hypothetical protein
VHKQKQEQKSHDYLNRFRKSFVEIQHPFWIKVLMKLILERLFLNIIKVIYDKFIANIMLNGEKLRPFPEESRTRKGCLVSGFY